MERGEFKPLIDRTYALDEIVAATEYVESGQRVGNVVSSARRDQPRAPIEKMG